MHCPQLHVNKQHYKQHYFYYKPAQYLINFASYTFHLRNNNNNNNDRLTAFDPGQPG